MSSTRSNADRLREAGLIDDSKPLSPEHQDLIDALYSEEVTALISIKCKLDDMGIPWLPITAETTRALMPL